MIELWGLKTLAIFDVWTIEHILSGISIGTLVKNHNNKHINRILKFFHINLNSKKKKEVDEQSFVYKIKEFWKNEHNSIFRLDLIGVLFLAYIWESLEHYLETGLAGGVVEYWFQGVEAWPNRLISDPLMLVLGYLIAKRLPKFVVWARLASLLWLIIHVFVYPHSMYLHYLF
ncbi:hypothetical protein HN587_01545 [Candidatus Woesearchaeota archaeon]|nr:hypothetical protein [Candidatus Woesearchaeota archaeon]